MEIKKTQNGDQTTTCRECQRELHLGNECLRVQLGVIGNRGFVPLAKPTHLCDDVY